MYVTLDGNNLSHRVRLENVLPLINEIRVFIYFFAVRQVILCLNWLNLKLASGLYKKAKAEFILEGIKTFSTSDTPQKCTACRPWQAMAQDILSDLVEDACLGLCFEVHRAVKQGYFFLDDTDQESMRDFGEHNLSYLAKRLHH